MGADIQPYIGSQSFCILICRVVIGSDPCQVQELTHIIIIWGRQRGILREM